MKNIILVMAVLFSATYAFGQIKVMAPNGDTKIGDTANPPSEKLHVTGANILVEDVTTTQSVGLLLKTTSQRWRLFGNAGGAINFRDVTNGKNIFRIDSGSPAGAFRITSTGFTGLGVAAPTARLHVGGDVIATGMVTSSDKKLKSGIKKYNYGLNEILQIEPKTYNYNGKGGIVTNKTHVGVIAQEFQKIFPDAVISYDYYENTDNDQKRFVDSYLAVDEKSILYAAVNAIKEQQILLNEKDETIKMLINKIEGIEEKLNLLVTGNTQSINSQTIEIEDATLEQNRPNPFNAETIINYQVPTKALSSRIEVYSISGALIKSIPVSNGKGQISVKALGLSAGTYTYNLIVDGMLIANKKMVLAK